MAVPWERFRLAAIEPVVVVVEDSVEASVAAGSTRRVGRNGQFSFAAASYRAEVWLAGEEVTVVCDGGLVHLQHRGVLIATHARRHPIDKELPAVRRGQRLSPVRRQSAATAPSV